MSGVVRAARDLQTESDVAIKQIRKSKLSVQDSEALRNELKILEQVTHENIVRLLDSVETATDVYLVLERMLGGEVRRAVVQPPLACM